MTEQICTDSKAVPVSAIVNDDDGENDKIPELEQVDIQQEREELMKVKQQKTEEWKDGVDKCVEEEAKQ